VAIAAALATIELLETELLANATRVGGLLMRRLKEELAGLPSIVDVRGVGLMIGVELATEELADAVAQGCYQKGLLVLECGEKAIRVSPPLNITEAQAEVVARLFADACKAAAG
jgi:4-aminobutyrate aminotransferase